VLGTITPLGERARGNKYWVTASSYIAGSIIGGATMGLLVAIVVVLVPTGPQDVEASWVAPVVALAVAVACVLDLLSVSDNLPPRRQVDKEWPMVLKGWAYGLGYGAQLGFGAITVVNSAIPYVLIPAIIVLGTPEVAILSGVAFGMTRGLLILRSRWVRDERDLLRLGAEIERVANLSRRVASVASGCLVLLAVSWQLAGR
jgi:hypothetical protein